MGRWGVLAGLALAAACAAGPTVPGSPEPTASDTPPAPVREFRGLWVATVANIDFPTTPRLGADAQRAELRVILDRAQALGFNAVILQVRAAGDALYRSPYEPWARSLTGTQGTDPGWDPLAEAVQEAHARGLELHAWFNPFRAGRAADSTALHPTHLWRARPDLARVAQGQLWFDPGEPEVQAHALRVIRDVVTRYDVDGIHLDDYFYPYPLTGAPLPIAFPDSGSYARHLAAGGSPMDRADWRRDNVNRFIAQLYADVKATKRTVKVGISPFGIWRPGFPAGVVGLDAFRDIFADSRRWLESGWMDYCAPQLYWSRASSGQPFVPLLDWWRSVNLMGRHVWPGLGAYRVADGTASAFTPGEITGQIDAVRAGAPTAGSRGVLLYNATPVRTNRAALGDSVWTRLIPPALVPASPWLAAASPTAPRVTTESLPSGQRVRWTPAGDTDVRWWLVQWRWRDGWQQRLVWGAERAWDVPAGPGGQRASAVAVRAVDGAMNVSAAGR
jgi:uncharacterized lipoprotein YddW (UPF0748 family)